MQNAITHLISDFATYSKEYPIVAGGLGMWGLGVATYVLRAIPARLAQLFVRHATTSLTITSTHTVYHDFLRWYETNKFSHNSRSIKISNGRYGYADMIKAMGYGVHYFMVGWTPIRLTLIQKEAQASERERDEIRMTVLGRSHKIFDKIFQEVKRKEADSDRIKVMKYTDCWQMASSQRKRDLDSVCLNEGVREKLIGFVDGFKAREEFNLRHGINHQTAVMLYGPPGTGKTSVIKALASHYDLQIYNLSPKLLSNIETAFANLPENALVVVEDIDSNASLFTRDVASITNETVRSAPGWSQDKKSQKQRLKEKRKADADRAVESLLSQVTNMSDVLNAIDGVSVSHGRILLATTNYVEKLDPALLRNGRFDLKIEIGYADKHAFSQFLGRFFPEHQLPDDFEIAENVCPADIQRVALDNLDNPQRFVDLFRKGSRTWEEQGKDQEEQGGEVEDGHEHEHEHEHVDNEVDEEDEGARYIAGAS